MNREPIRAARRGSSRRPPPRNMSAPRGRGKRKTRLGGLLLLTVFALAGLFVWQLSQTALRRTAVVAAGQTGRAYQVDAILIREETLFDMDSASAGLKYLADDGALVSRGAQIAQVYSSAYNQSDVNNLNRQLENIKAYYRTLLDQSTYPDTRLTALDYDISLLVSRIRAASQTSSGEAASLLSLKRQLESAMSERQSYLKQKFPNDAALNRYTDEEKTLRKRIESWTITYIADTPGIVSFYTDGYERMLSGETIESLTPALARGVWNGAPPEQTAAERARERVYKLVRPQGFYVAALTTDKNWKPQPDEPFKIAFEGLEDIVYDAKVTTTTRTGGELLVRFYIDADAAPTLNMRRAKATVGEPAVRGLLVPSDALRAKEGQIGVVLDMNPAVFIPVTVLSSDAREAIVRPVQSGTLAEGQRIRRF
ncbi:MAG: hypothetical protein LBH66_02125 [Oscillospiraceae bacterium]|jgi:hypothetical protein|nr:hypothetical protein [Oscillospiraceae bacterium]